MNNLKFKNFKVYSNFLNRLAKELTRFYYKKLDRPFKVINKSRGRGYDPVTQADRKFEEFIRSKIKKKFPKHEILEKNLDVKKLKVILLGLLIQ